MQKRTMQFKGQEVYLAKFDVIFKAVFIGEPELLASLLSSILEVNIKAEDMVILNTELAPDYESGKLSRLDIRIKTADRHVDVEIQLDDKKNMDKRSTFYLSKLYTDPMKAAMDFNELCPAIAINILDYSYLPYKEYHNRYRLKNMRTNDELTNVFEIDFIELPKVPQKPNNEKDMWMRFIAADNGEVLAMLAEQSPMIEKAVKRLVYVSADEIVRYQMFLREKDELDYRSDLKEHYDMGKQEGHQEGRQEGEHIKSIEVAKKLLSMRLGVEQVASITGLSVMDVSALEK